METKHYLARGCSFYFLFPRNIPLANISIFHNIWLFLSTLCQLFASSCTPSEFPESWKPSKLCINHEVSGTWIGNVQTHGLRMWIKLAGITCGACTELWAAWQTQIQKLFTRALVQNLLLWKIVLKMQRWNTQKKQTLNWDKRKLFFFVIKFLFLFGWRLSVKHVGLFQEKFRVRYSAAKIKQEVRGIARLLRNKA